MKNKKSVWGIGLIVGLVLNFIGMMLGIEHGGNIRSIYGALLFGGAILETLSINRISRISYEKEFPDLVEKEKIDCPIWIVFVLVGLYFLKSGIEWYYTNKYQKEM